MLSKYNKNPNKNKGGRDITGEHFKLLGQSSGNLHRENRSISVQILFGWIKSSFSLLNKNSHSLSSATKTRLWTQQFLCVLIYFSNQVKSESDFIIMNKLERLCSQISTEAFHTEKRTTNLIYISMLYLIKAVQKIFLVNMISRMHLKKKKNNSSFCISGWTFMVLEKKSKFQKKENS